MHKTAFSIRPVYGILNYTRIWSSLYLLPLWLHGGSFSDPTTMVQVCHSGEIRTINSNALAAHLNHGDIQLIDSDGDGYYTNANDCGLPIDCDDSNASISVCSTIAVGSPHPIYGGIVFESDGSEHGKLVASDFLKGANFGYSGIQHDIPWTTSLTDGATNTAALLVVHSNFDPIRFSILKGPDWYLPSIGELEIIKETIFDTGIAFDAGVYLSSTDAGNSSIQSYYFHPTDFGVINYSHYGTGAYTLRIRSF